MIFDWGLFGSAKIDLSWSAVLEVGIEASVSLWKGKWTSWSRQLIGACYRLLWNAWESYPIQQYRSWMNCHVSTWHIYTILYITHLYVFPCASLVLIWDLFSLSCVEAATCKRNLSEMYVGMRAIMSSKELILWSLLKWCMPFWFTSGVKVEQKECMCFYNLLVVVLCAVFASKLSARLAAMALTSIESRSRIEASPPKTPQSGPNTECPEPWQLLQS